MFNLLKVVILTYRHHRAKMRIFTTPDRFAGVAPIEERLLLTRLCPVVGFGSTVWEQRHPMAGY
jgi:hypothetical protein